LFAARGTEKPESPALAASQFERLERIRDNLPPRGPVQNAIKRDCRRAGILFTDFIDGREPS
jgi:hypothetical protein